MFKCHLEEKENMLFLNLALTLALGLHFIKSTTYIQFCNKSIKQENKSSHKSTSTHMTQNSHG